VVPKLSVTAGAIRWAGPALGAHTGEVLGGLLGLAEADIEDLRARGIV
jgi:formyl-CoA transferase